MLIDYCIIKIDCYYLRKYCIDIDLDAYHTRLHHNTEIITRNKNISVDL